MADRANPPKQSMAARPDSARANAPRPALQPRGRRVPPEPGRPDDLLALQQTIYDRAVVRQRYGLGSLQGGSGAPVQRMSVRLTVQDAKQFDESQAAMETYLEEKMVPFETADFSALGEGETLHLWSHGGFKKFGGLTMEQLAKVLVDKGLRTCKQIILVGCNPEDAPLAQGLGTALFELLSQAGPAARPRIPVYATRGNLYGPDPVAGGADAKAGLQMTMVPRTPEHLALEAELEAEMKGIDETFNLRKESRSAIFHAGIDRERGQAKDVAWKAFSARVALLEAKIMAGGGGEKLLLPPDEKGARKLNPKAVSGYVHPPDATLESGLAQVAPKDRAVFRSIGDYLLRKAMQHGARLSSRFGARIHALFSLDRPDAIRLAAEVQRWCDAEEKVVRDKR